MKILKETENSLVFEDDGVVTKNVQTRRGNFGKKYSPEELVDREMKALYLLKDMEGIQQILERIGNKSFTSVFINQEKITSVDQLDDEFFEKLRMLFEEMEKRGVLKIGVNKDEVFVNQKYCTPEIVDFGAVLFLDEDPQWQIIFTKLFNRFKIWDLKKRFGQRVANSLCIEELEHQT